LVKVTGAWAEPGRAGFPAGIDGRGAWTIRGVSNMLLNKTLLLQGVLLPILATGWLPVAGISADSTVERAAALLERGDSCRALAVLDSVLDSNEKHWEARLARGRLYFDLGRYDSAEQDFLYSLYSESPHILCRAHIGLGDLEARLPRRKAQAIQYYRKAIQNYPGSLEAHYKLALASLAMETAEGVKRVAVELIDILCLDPSYRDAHVIWRDAVKIRNKDDLRRAAECLEKYIPGHPEHDSLLLDAASYRYLADQCDQALLLLDRLEYSAPDHKPASRYLLRARCLAELDDTFGFQAAYGSALASAEKTGDFSELVSDASAIFHPAEQSKADSLETAEQWAGFFRVFWARRDPDPLNLVNERLFEHYRRLRAAERQYTIPNPYVRAQRSRDYYRLMNMPFMLAQLGDEYDSDLFWERNRDLLLEQRGLLYIRHGPPDEIEKPGSEYTDSTGRIHLGSGPPQEAEVWRYGSVYFPFIYADGSGGQYFFYPLSVKGIGNITKAMDTETFKEPLPELETDCYAVDFMAPDGGIEFETYQSVSVEESGMNRPPRVGLAVFDESWKELDRDSSVAVKADIPGGTLWVAANRVRVEPGKLVCASRMDIPGKRAVWRQAIAPETYHRLSLELSGIVLGSPAPLAGGTHSRMGVELLPRPSLTYSAGEIMTVYLEVYGLRRSSAGARGYSVSVTITRNVENPGVFGKVRRLLTSGGRERASSLTLTFDRQPSTAGETVIETFTVDTSLLLPGEYRMGIGVADGNSRGRRKVGSVFRLLEPE